MTDKITSGKGVGSALGGAISDKLKARATGVKEKFDPMNIAKFMTGGSRLGPAILGKLTGRSQSDINYFAGDKKRKNSYTQVPTSMATPGEGLGGSAVDVLNKMLAFMMNSRERDLKKKETAKQFIEEQKVEEQRRQDEFLKLLREYTSLSGTATITKKEEGPGIFDFIKDMIGGMIDKLLQPFKWLLENKDKLLGILRLFAGPLAGMLLAGSAIVWLADQLKDYFRENVVNMNAISPEKAAELLQTPGAYREIEKYGGREALMKIAKEGHLEAAKILATGDIKKINDAGGEEFLKQVVARGPAAVPESAVKEDLSQFSEQGPKRPIGTGLATQSKQADWDKKWSKIYDPKTGKRLDLIGSPTAVPEKTSEQPSPDPVQKQEAPAATPGSTTTPIPQMPVSSRMNDAVQENQDLSVIPPGNTQTSSPVLTTNTSSVDLPDRPIPATATVRDKTPILDHVLQQSLAPV